MPVGGLDCAVSTFQGYSVSATRFAKVWRVAFHRDGRSIGLGVHRQYPKAFRMALDEALGPVDAHDSAHVANVLDASLDLIQENLANRY
jgi:predicted NAD/FAD-binding protein